MISPLNLPQNTATNTAPASSVSQRFSRYAIAGSVAAGVVLCIAVQAAAAHMQNYLFDRALHTAVHKAPAQAAFGEGQQAPQLTKVLSGVSGEAFSPSAMRTAVAQLGEAHGDTTLSNVSPAAWDRLSAGGCMTLTTKSGQTLSFRIVGSRPVGDAQLVDALPRIDLAVTTCTATGEPVAKAVIEPERQQPAKSAVGQRAL